MKLTTKGRYAVTAMLDLALRYDKGAVTLAEIAKRQGISLSYLEQLFAKLRRSGLVDSVRGPGGGYTLAMEPNKISVAEIIVSINENIDATRCGGEKNCHGDETCLTHQLWEDLSIRIHEFLSGITLGELVTKPHVQEVASRQEGRMRAAAH
ncbi:MAG: Fe-S cluster assembly transcriptional regulator IscR [Candidatus Muproteobacteria bacterium RIFCSPHIGHO2_12_FULL_60_33]|uniref:Fe-S cluster assembly transcriptional regulator IscR n=1 Tax=Candidatus Muproteobacteria bacterium RIFCSPLOWO2_01_FULL_60_18 TaxID=1817768 RepID=A0A1F6U0T4_9PROT|nr:MAG: Fe-S cluster assembly transcriptional regulator IscR [Candidatus Muproteobacteria bacterium RIFCSPHIGHO2_01_60_12]OGI50994.1 MAG: Fe-S cluster assembly transcriptional regulator IscR [Candidatus Muproteobacteria bacterium RIFCSPLOWO2_01_FULL_60_18]OGI55633.1 MAG: Fe-S cluster assembly transcriptional regulator IscR [Candidatus Muproteobacteria bacterium RIFCSPHIGHO2_12_FULL_60_33]OGI59894.1 MAG: Fe-S cluster assembly transcriptional regulator IscR [Candidatus Muproteobacteria bacterium R